MSKWQVSLSLARESHLHSPDGYNCAKSCRHAHKQLHHAGRLLPIYLFTPVRKGGNLQQVERLHEASVRDVDGRLCLVLEVVPQAGQQVDD